MSGQDGEMALDLVQNSLDALAEVLGVRTTSAAELLADLVDDDTLTIRFHRPHWQLEDPWLDASVYIAEHKAGRHRAGTPVLTLGAVVDHVRGTQHACRCDRCVVAP